MVFCHALLALFRGSGYSFFLFLNYFLTRPHSVFENNKQTNKNERKQERKRKTSKQENADLPAFLKLFGKQVYFAGFMHVCIGVRIFAYV